jgi:hypothetical protein
MASTSGPAPSLLWPLQPGAFPGARLRAPRRCARCARCRERRRPASGLPSTRRHATSNPAGTAAYSRADAATSAVLAALPSGAKPSLRLCCRAGRAAVDAHTRRLEVWQGLALLSPAAAARMPLLQEVRVSAFFEANVLALAAALPALAQGPAQLRRVTVVADGGGAAVGGLMSALSCLTALTRLGLSVELADGQWAAPPLVLPWAHIEVGLLGLRRAGRVASRGHVVAEVASRQPCAPPPLTSCSAMRFASIHTAARLPADAAHA